MRQNKLIAKKLLVLGKVWLTNFSHCSLSSPRAPNMDDPQPNHPTNLPSKKESHQQTANTFGHGLCVVGYLITLWTRRLCCLPKKRTISSCCVTNLHKSFNFFWSLRTILLKKIKRKTTVGSCQRKEEGERQVNSARAVQQASLVDCPSVRPSVWQGIPWASEKAERDAPGRRSLLV